MATQNKAAPSRSVFSELYPVDAQSARTLRAGRTAFNHLQYFCLKCRSLMQNIRRGGAERDVFNSNEFVAIGIFILYCTWEAHRAYLWMPL
jgi:hypothetical protein